MRDAPAKTTPYLIRELCLTMLRVNGAQLLRDQYILRRPLDALVK